MPNGFPNFRHDPTTSPRYIIKTSPASTTSAQSPRYQDDPSNKETKPERLSEWQYPIEKPEGKKVESSKSEKADERSLSSQNSRRGLLRGFGK